LQWDGNHVKLSIAHSWHTFDTDISGTCCYDNDPFLPLTDEALINAYNLAKLFGPEPFKYDVSDPFKGVFWDDQYHRDSEFPTISGNIKSAVVNNEILTVEVSMLYDNTGAGGSPDQHLRGLWADRFNAKISTDTGDEDIGIPKELDEQSDGEYILKYDVSGIDINSVLHLEVRDNVYDSDDPGGDSCELSKPLTFVSAVEKGLHWLQTQQNPDGSWQNSVGITSMTALAFLNAGYTEDDPTVNKAIQYILANQNADRSFGRETYDTASEYNLSNRSADRSFGGGTYDTSLAVLALVATHNSEYNDEIEDAVNWLKDSQWDEDCLWGSVEKDDWRYGGFGYGSHFRPDLSNTQFALMALDAAPSISKDDLLWDKAQVFLARVQNRQKNVHIPNLDYTVEWNPNYNKYDDGGFVYLPGSSLAGNMKSYGSMTAAGIWCLRLCGVDVTDARVQKGLDWLANNEDCTFDDNPCMPDGRRFQYYYYMTIAKALAICFLNDLSGEDWYSALSIKLADLQYDDGYWVNSYTGHGFTI
jgi:squalene-hopene/tetraprenyl-beta-curcumene cyclase